MKPGSDEEFYADVDLFYARVYEEEPNVLVWNQDDFDLEALLTELDDEYYAN